MITHLTDDELVELIDAGIQDQHLSTCAQCLDRRGEFEATLAMASRVSETQWTTLQGERLVHAVRRRLRDRRAARRPVWQAALGGALVSGALAVLLLVLLPPDLAPELVLDERLVQDAVVVGSQTVVDGGLVDEELAILIEMYLIETSSADELLLELDKLSDGEYFTLLYE